MSVLTRELIKERVEGESGGPRIVLDPFIEDAVQPTSYDIHLSDTFAEPNSPQTDYGEPDPTKPYLLNYENALQTFKPRIYTAQDKVIIRPGQCLLAYSLEYMELPTDLCASVRDKSTLGRFFLTACNGGAGWVDAGFKGHLVLELKNNSQTHSLELRYGMPIAQLVFHRTAGVTAPYNGNYQNQAKDFGIRRMKRSLMNMYLKSNAVAQVDLLASQKER